MLVVFLLAVSIVSGNQWGKVVEVSSNNTVHRLKLWQAVETLGLDVWAERANKMTIRIPPSGAAFHALGFETKVVIDDVQALIDEEAAAMAKPNLAFFENYHSYEDIVDYLETQLIPHDDNLHKEMFTVGQSALAKEIRGIEITGPGDKAAKKGLYFIGGQHAREWVSPATVAFLADQFVRSTSDEVATVLQDFIIYFVPVVNVDGYAHSRTSGARMWRKTRGTNPGSSCLGTDPNRNWGYMWNEGGSSNNPCSDIYHGSGPLSAPSVSAVAEHIKSLSNVRGFIDFHAFSQMVLYPWGYTCSSSAPDVDDLDELAADMSKAIADTHGTTYIWGDSCNTIYLTSGGSDDWTYGALDIKYSYCFEGRDTGRHGFILPPDQIIPSGEENFAAVLAMAKHIQAEEEQ